MAAQWIIDMQHALVTVYRSATCSVAFRSLIMASVIRSRGGTGCVEADVLRVRAVAALDAAALRKSLRRTQNVAASTLFDVRQRATMKVLSRYRR